MTMFEQWILKHRAKFERKYNPHKLAVVGGTEHTFEFDTISNCCGAYIDPDIGFCEECGEHADVIKISK